jgi:hypothetical protein
MVLPCELIAQQLGLLFTCTPMNGYIRIETPFLYPDGDIVDVFCQERGDTIILTDLGETQRWLKMQTATQRKSSKQRHLLDGICLNHGIEYSQGALLTQIRPSEDFATALIRLSQGILRVSDLWFTFRHRVGESIIDDVDDLLREQPFEVEQYPSISGISSKSWQPDFQTKQEDRKTLIRVLSTGSRAATPDLVHRTIAMWYDLLYLREDKEVSKFISLFDDTVDVWKLEDIKQVERLSDIAYWSRSDEFLKQIA